LIAGDGARQSDQNVKEPTMPQNDHDYPTTEPGLGSTASGGHKFIDTGTATQVAEPLGFQHASNQRPGGNVYTSPVGMSRTGSPAKHGMTPAPLPKRPKGKWFVGTVLGLFLCGGAFTTWDAMFRFPVRGEVVGRVLRVAPTWSGTVRTTHVVDGQEVRQGDLLFTCVNLEHEHRQAELTDQLRLAQAELSAQISRLQWESQLRTDRNRRALGEYYEVWGRLLAERSKLDQINAELERLDGMHSENALTVSQQQLESVRFGQQGQRDRVEKLESAVAEMKKRIGIYDEDNNTLTAQLQPPTLKIEQLRAELLRLREVMREGEIRSPVSGQIVKVLRYAGEYAEVSEPLAEIVEMGSLEAVLYVTQRRLASLENGQQVDVHVEPLDDTIRCNVTRIGQRMTSAPLNLARYYARDETLLPVYLKPIEGSEPKDGLRLGCEVKVSNSPQWWSTWEGTRWPFNATTFSQEDAPSIGKQSIDKQSVGKQPVSTRIEGV